MKKPILVSLILLNLPLKALMLEVQLIPRINYSIPRTLYSVDT